MAGSLAKAQDSLSFPLMRLTFGSWELDTGRRLLTRSGAAASLSPKAFDLLALLAGAPEKAFSKAELHAHLWPDTFVSDGSLTILVAEIRDVLEDNADKPEYVRTVRRFGYGFCAPVAIAPATKPSTAKHSNGWLIWGDKSIELADGETLLGRATEAHVRFDVPGVSRRHARIISNGASVLLEDLGSQNGTFVRGERITAPAVLVDGDDLRLGPVSVVFRLLSPDSSTLPM
jgi:DNA-binding winged helix-turn-helix (wHTH) protein